MQHQHENRRRVAVVVALAASISLAGATAAPAMGSSRGSAPAAPAAIEPGPLASLVRNIFRDGVLAVRPASRSASTRTASELAGDAGAARSAVGTAESASGSRFARSSAAAGRLAPETVEVRLQRWAAEDGPEILRETECSLMWGQMYPDEQDAVEGTEGLESAGAQSEAPVLSASADSIAKAAVRRAARAVGRPVYVTTAWMQWAQGVQENATDALGGPQGVTGLSRTVELDDGVASLALVGYARYCLQPPT